METKTNRETVRKILINVDELQDMLSVGRSTAIKVGAEAGAIVRIGRRRLYDVRVIEEYVKQLMGE